MKTLTEVPVAILAGGLATRLGPSTAQCPKAMVDVAGRPFIDHQLELLARAGVRRVVLCLGHMGEQVEKHVGSGEALGLEVEYSWDGERLLGTGGALRRAAPLLGQLFFVLYGDSYLDVDYCAVLSALTPGALGVMTVLHNEGRWDRSNVVFGDGQILRYDKRTTDPAMHHVDYGLSLLVGEALDRIPPDAPFDLAELFSFLVGEGRMAGHEVHRRFYEIGSPEGLRELRALLDAGPGFERRTS